MSRTVYLFFGAPGSGKGSLAQRCVDGLGWNTIATGQLCRYHVQHKTELGAIIQQETQAGRLVPDEIINEMVHDWLAGLDGNVNHVVFDGYPRTRAQADTLYLWLQNDFADIQLVLVELHVSDETAKKRMLSRMICPSCGAVYSTDTASDGLAADKTCKRCDAGLSHRKDDTQAVIAERLKTYHKHRNDVLSYYTQKGYRPIVIDGGGSIEAVFASFKKAIGVAS